VVHVGDRTRLRAIVKDERGNAVDRAVTWVSNNAAVARVEPDGTVTTIGPGHVSITATIDGVTAVMPLNIAAQAPPPVVPVPANVSAAAAPLPATTTESRSVAAPSVQTKSGSNTRLLAGAVGVLVLAAVAYF